MKKYFRIVFIVSLILTIGVSACKDEKKIPVKKEVVKKVTQKAKPVAKKKKKKVKPVAKVANKYFLIIGSFQNVNNAKRLQQKLSKAGYNSKIFNAANGFHRVSYKSFSDRNKAFKELRAVRATEKNKENWLYIKQ